MHPTEVSDLFRIYIDEPDLTFVSDSDVKNYLGAAYREFRDGVCDIDPLIYDVSQDITLTNALSYDLADPPGGQPSFLGSTVTATNGRIIRINNLFKVDSDGLITNIFHHVASRAALGIADSAYLLSGTTLYFSRKLTGTYSLHYVPEAPAWDSAFVTAGFIDDLTSFHDVIALLATKQYAIQNGAVSEPTVMQLSERVSRLGEYLRERSYPGVDYVTVVPWLEG